MAKSRRRDGFISKIVKKKTRPKRGKHCQWSEAAMSSAIQAVRDQGMSQRTACKTFNVPRCTLHVRLCGKTELGAKPGHPTNLSHEEEEKLVDFASNRAGLGIGFGRQQFLGYAERYAVKHNKRFKRGKPSMKWWRGMRRRHQRMTLRQPEGTSAVRHQCMDPHKVAKYFMMLRQVIDDNDLGSKPHTIWNMDETGMQLDHKPGKVVAQTGSKYLHSRTSGNKELITVVGAVNAAGGALPPHLIVKGKTKRSLYSFQMENAPDGCTWSVSDSGWTKQGIALLWFKESFLRNIGSDRPQLLIVDGHDSHNFLELIDVAVENQIHIIELPAHTSNWLQPCDRTVFGPLKTAYRKACEELTTGFPGSLVSRASFCGLLQKAWSESVIASNIKSGFRACGIYPFCPDAIPSEAFMPNSLYSVATIMENEQSGHPPATIVDGPNESASATHAEPLSTTVTNLQPEISDVAESHPTVLSSVIQSQPSTSAVTMNCETISHRPTADKQPHDSQNSSHVTQFLACEPAVLDALCAAAPPRLALALFESSLSEQQLCCFRYCYDKGYSLDKDETYFSWLKLKADLETKTSDEGNSIDVSFTSLPDIGNSSDVDVEITVDDLMSAVSMEQTADSQPTISTVILPQPVTSSESLDCEEASSTVIKQSHDGQLSSNEPNVSDVPSSTLPQSGVCQISQLLGQNQQASPSTSSSQNFPFNNRSFPGDPDSDILPYPAQIIRKKKSVNKQKFFLLTSREAHATKLKEQQEKLKREKEKQERATARKQKMEEKAQRKLSNEENSSHVALEVASRPIRQSVRQKEQHKKKETKRMQPLKQKQSKKDHTPCGVCGVVHFRDKSGRNWIQCSECKVWYHNACQGLDENHETAFLCIGCESD